MTVSVTFDHEVFGEYTVSVNRSDVGGFRWRAERDLDGLISAGNEAPTGAWTDGTTMWVADSDDQKLYAYTVSTGARDEDKDIDLHSDNDDPRGIWSDGTTMWVIDSDDRRLYAYTLSNGNRDRDEGVAPRQLQRPPPRRLVRRQPLLCSRRGRRQAVRLPEQRDPFRIQGVQRHRTGQSQPDRHVVRRGDGLGDTPRPRVDEHHGGVRPRSANRQPATLVGFPSTSGATIPSAQPATAASLWMVRSGDNPEFFDYNPKLFAYNLDTRAAHPGSRRHADRRIRSVRRPTTT